FDGGLDNVFPDDAGPRAADAPELLGQWKSMPGGSEDGEGYDLDAFVAGRKTLRDVLGEQIPFVLSDPIDRLIAQHLVDQLDEAGYLQGSTAETALKLGKPAGDIERVLSRLQ